MPIFASWSPLLPGVADYCHVFGYSDLEYLNLKYINSYKVRSSVNRRENLVQLFGSRAETSKNNFVSTWQLAQIWTSPPMNILKNQKPN